MTNFFLIDAEVAGGWGSNTEFTRTPGRPVIVHKLHYQFDGWLGDALVETSPCYIVTRHLASTIENNRLTGARFGEVETTKSDQFMEIQPDTELPDFVWLKVEGEAGIDDFAVTQDLRLVVSARALAVLRDAGISHAIVEPFDHAVQ